MLVAPQAPKSVLPVVDAFCNNKMRTFSRIRAHQSAAGVTNHCETESYLSEVNKSRSVGVDSVRSLKEFRK